MATFGVKMTSRIPQITAAALAKAALVTAKAAFDIEGHAKMAAPVDTGFLKSSIQASGGGLEWVVSVGAEYGIYQEFGTRYNPPQPYLIPAAEMVRPSYVAAMSQIAR